MENISTIKTKNDTGELGKEELSSNEALEFVEKNRDFFEHYSKGQIKIKGAPKGLNTFAFNLEDNSIYINSMFYRKFGFSDEKTIFSTLHEIEHFGEKIQILNEEGGEKIFERYLEKNKKSKAFALMDNCLADIRQNRAVVSKTNTGMGELERKLYKEDLFKEKDFRNMPKHIQLCQALLRESRVADEECLVDEEVRKIINEIKNKKDLMEIMTNPETPMSMRLKLQDKYIWPKVRKLLEEDIEDRKKQNEDKKKQEGNNNVEKSKEGDQVNDNENNEENKDSENQENKDEKNGDKKEKKDADEKKEKDSKGGKEKKDEENIEEKDSNEIFKKDYDEANEKFPEAVPIEEIEKNFKDWKEKIGKNKNEDLDKAYANKIGVKKEDLENYRKIVQDLNSLVNEKMGVSVLEEMKELFSRIISKRINKKLAPKYPVEEGDYLVDPSLLVSSVKSGELKPKVWENLDFQEKRGEQYGEVEITLVCDRSDSMTEGDGSKAIEQRKSAVLVMETLKEFAEMCDQDKINIEKPLEIKSEIYTFASEEEDSVPIKKMSPLLGEKERIDILNKLYDLPGSTTDYVCLESIASGLTDEIKNKIKEGELKKIVLVLTDGGSDEVSRVKNSLRFLRENGVITIGIGLTDSGYPVKNTYAPNAMVVLNVNELPIVLAELLKEHLKDI